MACRSADDVDVALPGILEDVSAGLAFAHRIVARTSNGLYAVR